MLRNLFLKSLRDQWGAVLGWGLGLASLAYFTLLIFPSIKVGQQYEQLLKNLPPEVRAFLGNVESFSTIDGYVTSSLLSYLPLVLTIYVVMTAVNTITSEIETGTMDFLLAHAVPRWRVVLEKYAALAMAVLAICVLLGFGMWLGGLTIQSDVPLTKWLLAGLNVVPLTLLFGSMAFAMACATRGRSLAIAVASTLAAGSFIFNGLAQISEKLKPFREWTLYYWFSASKPFTTGLILEHIAILLMGCLVCLGIGMAAFQRRDIIP